MTTELTDIHGPLTAEVPLALSSSEGLGPAAEAKRLVAHYQQHPQWFGGDEVDEVCRLIDDAVAAERERCVKLVPTQHVPEKWHESEAHQQADMSFCAGWNAARKAMLSALNEGPNARLTCPQGRERKDDER